MNLFSNQQVEEYYDKTKIHYQRAWALNETLAMHYGYTDEKVRKFIPSLLYMNRQLATFGGIKKEHYVLDAGCGVGGSSIFLAKEIGCRVKGITITRQQVEDAKKNAKENGVEHLVSFEVADYTKTGFDANTFDIVWGLESFVHASDKEDVLREAYRVLKKDGRLILGEYLRTAVVEKPKERKILYDWLNAWAIMDIETQNGYQAISKKVGFKSIQFKNVTEHIKKSAWRMYYGAHYLAVLSWFYRIYNPKVSYFADNHYKGLYYQYPALKKKLWNYYFIECRKTHH